MNFLTWSSTSICSTDPLKPHIAETHFYLLDVANVRGRERGRGGKQGEQQWVLALCKVTRSSTSRPGFSLSVASLRIGQFSCLPERSPTGLGCLLRPSHAWQREVSIASMYVRRTPSCPCFHSGVRKKVNNTIRFRYLWPAQTWN